MPLKRKLGQRRRIRTRIFLGCEGTSERGYAKWLQHLSEELTLNIFIDAAISAAGGGDPLFIVRDRIKEMVRRETRYGKYSERAIFLDNDLVQSDEQKRREANQLARNSGIDLIWQDPDHEGLLLRHCNGCAEHRPPRGDSQRRLRQEWASYEKPASALDLSKRFNLIDLRRACVVEPDLANFLRKLGFPV